MPRSRSVGAVGSRRQSSRSPASASISASASRLTSPHLSKLAGIEPHFLNEEAMESNLTLRNSK
jgi:hypothetical protein